MSRISFADRYTQLSVEQKKVVDTIFGSLMVIAGPGSGKTEVLSLRIAQILQKTDIGPGGILCLTFTDSARMNMRERLNKLIGTEADRVNIHTFHSFAMYIMERFSEYFFGGATLSPVDKAVATEIVSGILSEVPHDHPFASFHPEHGYVYLRDILQSISHLKRAGVRFDEFEGILTENHKEIQRLSPYINAIFSKRLSKKDIGDIEQTLVEAERMVAHGGEQSVFPALTKVITSSIREVLEEAKNTDSATPLSTWKTAHTKLVDDKRVLKEQVYEEKMFALLSVYQKYQTELGRRGYMDFDDMIISLITVLEREEHVRLSLQEEFQFVLVDEFQDTNTAQMRILKAITYDATYNPEPNIMVVGDDDQSIYKFQGAELSNMFQFTTLFPKTVVLSLGKNYRSTKEVVAETESLISLLSHSLDQSLHIEKVKSGERKGESTIEYRSYRSVFDEYTSIAEDVKRLIDSGTSPSSIAVIGRHHKSLEVLAPYLRHKDIPISYEREQNVLRMPPIQELLTLLSYLALSIKDGKEADYLLSQILSYPYWGISRERVWEISEEARHSTHSWLALMRQSTDEPIQLLAQFLSELSVAALSLSIESVIDILIGSKSIELGSGTYTSPYKKYYFDTKDDGVYLSTLSGLRVFVHAVREYYKGGFVTIEKIPQFIDIYTQHNLELLDTTPVSTRAENVTLLSAHKAKGLEFDVVYIISANALWTERGAISKISFPMNMPIVPDLDDRDDFIRILYVAMTRAKHTLYISSHTLGVDGKEKNSLPFFAEKPVVAVGDSLRTTDTLSTLWSTLSEPPFVQTEQVFLQKQLRDYRMSVTHLNNFLDVTHGGPQMFFEKNILLFPEKKSLSAIYGTAIHHTLTFLWHTLSTSGFLPTLDEAVVCMDEVLLSSGLSPIEVTFWSGKGKDVLRTYIQTRADRFTKEALFEKSFAYEGVVLPLGARLVGNIDKLVRAGDTVTVTDFKTGKVKTSWENMDPSLYNYKRQLLFYKLLVERSKTFVGTTVTQGVLEFLDPLAPEFVDLALDMTLEDMDRFEKLVSVVYQKIINLDFPPITKYSQDLLGCITFEEDLLSGRV